MGERLNEQRHGHRLALCPTAAIDFCGILDRIEEIAAARDVLGRAQEQPPILTQRVVENRDQALLEARIEIDQQVAAGDEIDTRKRRVLDQIVVGDPHHVADRLRQNVIVLLGVEIAIEKFERHILHRGVRVARAPRLLSICSSISVAKICTAGRALKRDTASAIRIAML